MTITPKPVSRRSVLAAGAAGVTSMTLAPVSFAAPARPTGARTKSIEGHLDPGAPDFVYLPVRVPRGVRQLDVAYSYDKPTVPAGALGNACDVGAFDQRGIELGSDGFRGWSGGFRTSFSGRTRS